MCGPKRSRMKSCIKRSTAFLERYDVQEIIPVTSDFGLPTDVLNIIMERVVIGGRSEGVTRDVLAQNLCT
jgi:spore maturation protein SpmB